MDLRRSFGKAVGLTLIVLVSALGPSATTSHAGGLPGVKADTVSAAGLPGFARVTTVSGGLPG